MARGDYISNTVVSRKTKPEARAVEVKVKDVNAIKKSNIKNPDSSSNCLSVAMTEQLQKTYKFNNK